MLKYFATRSVRSLFTASEHVITYRSLSTTNAVCRQVEDRKEMLKSLPTPDEGTAGENAYDIDTMGYATTALSAYIN